MMAKILPALGAVGIAAVLLGATMARAFETNSARVSYGDLNLTSVTGQQKLQHRIAFAAKSVCDTDDVPDPVMVPAVSACRIAAIASAQPAYRHAIGQAYHPSVTVLEASALLVTRP